MLFHSVIAFVASVAFLSKGVLSAPRPLSVNDIAVNIKFVATISGDANVALSKITERTSPQQLQTAATVS